MENRVAYCGHECAHQAELMSPAIWSDLPEELMQRVFARLPLAGIIRLLCLSKQWNRILNSHNFKQVCTDAHPKMFAIIPEYCSSGSFEVRLYDLRSNTWHAMEIDTGYRQPFRTMNASDGGLVCFAGTIKEESIRVPVLVCNPLTRAVRALPLHSHYKHPPKMLQLVMDRVSKCYQVLIVSMNRKGGLVAEIFHSNTGAWTTTNLSDLKYFSGYQYSWWKNDFDNTGRGYPWSKVAPCVFDCAEGHFLKIPVVADLRREGCLSVGSNCAPVQDRFYIVCRKVRKAIEGGGFSEPEYYIGEYQGLGSGANWLKLKDHHSCKLGYPATSSFYLILYACKGFLLVGRDSKYSHEEYGLDRLYDLSTGKWHALSQAIPKITGQDMMCELQWDVVP